MANNKNKLTVRLDDEAYKIAQELPPRKKGHFVSEAIKALANNDTGYIAQQLEKLSAIDKLVDKINTLESKVSSLEGEIKELKKKGVQISSEDKEPEDIDVTKLNDETYNSIFGVMENFESKAKK